MPQIFKGKDILWFINSSVALAGLTNGVNSGPEMDRGCAAIHLLLAQLQADAWGGLCSQIRAGLMEQVVWAPWTLGYGYAVRGYSL